MPTIPFPILHLEHRSIILLLTARLICYCCIFIPPFSHRCKVRSLLYILYLQSYPLLFDVSPKRHMNVMIRYMLPVSFANAIILCFIRIFIHPVSSFHHQDRNLQWLSIFHPQSCMLWQVFLQESVQVQSVHIHLDLQRSDFCPFL